MPLEPAKFGVSTMSGPCPPGDGEPGPQCRGQACLGQPGGTNTGMGRNGIFLPWQMLGKEPGWLQVVGSHVYLPMEREDNWTRGKNVSRSLAGVARLVGPHTEG